MLIRVKKITIHAERESVCMADDCNAPNPEDLVFEADADLNALLQAAAKYVPKMSNCEWTVRCGKEVLGLLMSDETAVYRIVPKQENIPLSILPEQRIFCRKRWL